MAFSLDINGRTVEVDVPADMPLLWVLRETLGLTGTKYRLRHRRLRRLHGACRRRADALLPRCRSRAPSGVKITTIEGIAGKPAQAVQAAWQKLDVVQCGYCQSGQIMAATALLAENPKPSDRRHRRGHDRQSLSLRHLSTHPCRDPRGRRDDGGPEPCCDHMHLRPSRRGFLVGTTAAGLTLGFSPVLRPDRQRRRGRHEPVRRLSA